MASRSREGQLGLQTYLNGAELGVAGLTKGTPKDVIEEVMERELKRLKRFTGTMLFAAEDVLHIDLVSRLKITSQYLPPPQAYPELRFRPPDEYYLRELFWPKEFLDQQRSQPETLLPQNWSAGIQIESAFVNSWSAQGVPQLKIELDVNYDVTVRAFKWLLQEWRRPIGQLLRGLQNLEINAHSGARGIPSKSTDQVSTCR